VSLSHLLHSVEIGPFREVLSLGELIIDPGRWLMGVLHIFVISREKGGLLIGWVAKAEASIRTLLIALLEGLALRELRIGLRKDGIGVRKMACHC
jgi:hypothetical protein